MKKTILLITAIIILGSCSYDYSSGYRTGEVTKFSKKGWIYSTWEGELHISEQDSWSFSLDAEKQRGENITALKDSLLYALENGYRVRVHYNEEKGTDWNSSRGDTQYYVDEVTIIRE